MDELATALSVAEQYVPDSRKCVFEALGTPISKLKYALKFMPHGFPVDSVSSVTYHPLIEQQAPREKRR